MNSQHSSESQVEFKSLLTQLKARGLNKSRVAELIGKDRSAMTRYENDAPEVPRSVLIAMRNILSPQYPPSETRPDMISDRVMESARRLSELENSSPDDLETVERVIVTYHKTIPHRAKTDREASLARVAEAACGADAAALRAVQGQPKSSPPSSEAGGRTSHIAPPKPGIRRHSKTPPVPPDPAPK